MKGKQDERGANVVETSEASFVRDVFQRSRETPVIVDFWAKWCAPCRALGPIMERLAEEYAGRFVLVKAETEAVPQAATEFGVSGIPAVYAVVDDNVVDFFQGALPESAIRDWLERVLFIATADETRRLESTDPAKAEAAYRELTEEHPNDSALAIGLARVLLAQGKTGEARERLELLERRGFLEPEAERIKAELEIESLPRIDIESAREAVEAAPEDLAKQLAFAEALIGHGELEEALATCLSIVERDSGQWREEARQLMVDVFRVAADQEEMVNTYRRKLSTALY